MSIWEPFEEELLLFYFFISRVNPIETLYQGRLQMRDQLNNKWTQAHIELLSDKMLMPASESGKYEFIKLNCCILKKLKNLPNSKPKFGFKL
jgi:hypothetical protein